MKRVRYKNIVVTDTKRTSIILALFLAKWKKKKLDRFLPAALDAVGQFWTRTPWAPCITEDSSMCTELKDTQKKHTHTCTRILKTTNVFFQVFCRIVWPSRRHPYIWLYTCWLWFMCLKYKPWYIQCSHLRVLMVQQTHSHPIFRLGLKYSCYFLPTFSGLLWITDGPFCIFTPTLWYFSTLPSTEEHHILCGVKWQEQKHCYKHSLPLPLSCL